MMTWPVFASSAMTDQVANALAGQRQNKGEQERQARVHIRAEGYHSVSRAAA